MTITEVDEVRSDAIPYELLTDDQKEEVDAQRELWAKDFELFAREKLCVLDRDHPEGAKYIPFVFNPLQRALHDTIDKIRYYNVLRSKLANETDGFTPISEYPVHLVILKARKGGCSTYLVGRNFWRCEHNDGTKGVIMAHEKPAAENIAEIMSPFHYMWEDKSGYGTRRRIKKFRGAEVAWHPIYGSKIVTKTAGNRKGSSRSFTYNFLHISEEAHFPKSDEVSSALNAKVSYAEIYEESTANGEGNLFYESWRKAITVEEAIDRLERGEPLPQNWNKKFRFFWAWHQDPGYRRALMPGERQIIEKTLDEEEKELIEQFGCSFEQLAWRRDKIAGDCSDQAAMEPIDYFHQEYPSTPEEAFVSKGKTVFDQKKISRMREAGEQRLEAGECELFRLSRLSEGADFEAVPVKSRVADGQFKSSATYFRWARPETGHQYIIGGDAAQGLEHGDWSTCSVWDRTDGQFMEEVARFRAKVAAEELGEVMVWLAQQYNNAFLIPEGRFPGNATCSRILGLGYTNIYMRKNPDKVGEQGEPEAFFVGFQTSAGQAGNAKALIVELAVRILRDNRILIRHPEACREWKIFQQLDGKYSAPEGQNDDCVMSDLFGVFAMFSPGVAPYYDVKDQKKEEYDDTGAYLGDQAALDKDWHERAKQSRLKYAEAALKEEAARAALEERMYAGLAREARSPYD